MRIAIFTDNFYPEISGISDSILLTSKELANRGHVVGIFTPRYSQKDYGKTNARDEDIKFSGKIFRISSLPFPNSPTGQSRIVVPLPWRWMKVKKFRPDIIHTHDPFGVGIEALAAAKILRVPLVGTNHTPIEEFTAYTPLVGKKLTAVARRLFIWYYNRCAFVTCPSKYLENMMVRDGLKKPHCALSNPVELENYVPATDEQKIALKKELGFQDFTLLYSGRMAPEKNVDKIIRAARIMKDNNHKFTLALTGIGAAEPKLKKLAGELHLEKEIKFFGYAHENLLKKIYQASDVFVVMSTAESQCISLLKAYSAAIPALGAKARALPEFIDGSNGFTIKPGDFHDLAQKMIFFLENPQKRKEMGAHGLETVKHYSAKKIANEWEKLYHEVAANSTS